MSEWVRDNNLLAAPGKLKLRDGSCLDLTAIADPWAIDRDPKASEMANGVVVATLGGPFGIRPFERKDGTEDFFGVRYDGKLRVEISGWSPPNPAWASYWVASPERIEENRHSGLFRRLDLWPASEHGLEAYEGTGNRYYVDGRRLTQCRDYFDLERDGFRQVNCTAVSRDKSFMFSFRFDSRDVTNLPAALRRMEQTIAATQSECGQAAS